MIYGHFHNNREAIENQYRAVVWNEESGLCPEQLSALAQEKKQLWADEGLPRPIQKARLFALVLDHAQLAVTPEELFQDHIRHEFLVRTQRFEWRVEIEQNELKQLAEEKARLYALGLGRADYDFGHTVPDWYDVLGLGIPGLLARLRRNHQEKADSGELSADQEIFYQAGEIVYEAVLRYMERLSALCRAAAKDHPAHADRLNFCADDLTSLCQHAPETLHQALQLAYLFHILQEEIECERLRSLGGLDRVYRRFMENDLRNGVTREQLTEQWQDFFQKFHALTGDHLFGEPMYLGGELPDGSCAVNEFTYLILNAYDELSIANPKFHIRVSDNTPPEFTKAVLDCIRRGNSSFVFVSDRCAIPMMIKHVGATPGEAREYVPIGCYEPGILGREVACTGNGGISLPKMLELTLNNGVDPLTGEKIGLETGNPADFTEFDQLIAALRQQIAHITDRLTGMVCTMEKYYMLLNPSPLFSATMVECVQSGTDAYAGGAKYNNSSFYGYGCATLADSLVTIKKLVYDQKLYTLPQLNEILLSNWENQELLRLRIRKDPDKWGNNRPLPDAICRELCTYYADIVNGRPNGRGGHFKAALFTIDFNYYYGEHLGASADGRRTGDIISRNLGATSAMDKNGVTALIQSVTKLPHGEYPNGSVLDIMLHPSAVSGEEGLNAFYRILESYIELGGFAIHGNVMDPVVLRDAQQHPEKYPNLQVRVCGWNVYFNNLSRAEQDEFIARAEMQ